MGRHLIEVADILRTHRTDLEAARGGRLMGAERRVVDALIACRTPALGGHVERCDRCGHQTIAYNSCRNRHCPKCQEGARRTWLEEQQRDLLPVGYFHVVFTIPHELGQLAFHNKRVVYEILFHASGQTLIELGKDERHLGAELGVLSILHTWGQNLEHHPHVHCVVTGGGPSLDRTRWVACRERFFLPVRVMGRLFRGRFVALLREAYREKRLVFPGGLASLVCRANFEALLDEAYRKDWVVYAKPPFGGPDRVLKYLSRYTHRVAISNGRLTRFEAGEVSFLWKDYAHGCRRRVMTLSAGEFLRRFVMHVLPKGFVRIRRYGFLANALRRERLALCRGLLAVEEPSDDVATDDGVKAAIQFGACPSCKVGTMLLLTKLSTEDLRQQVAGAIAIDSS